MSELLGTFEQVVLLAVVALAEEAYGRSILRETQSEGSLNRAVAAGAVYATLDRLEQKGCLSSRLEPGTPERGGRARRFYRLTAAGAAALNETRRILDRTWHGKRARLEAWEPRG